MALTIIPTSMQSCAPCRSGAIGQRPEPAVGRTATETSGGEARDALATLVQHIADGDEPALTRLYDLTVTRIYSLARAITGCDADAEEVSCDTYVQVWSDAARFDPARGTTLGWMTSIARSRARDLRRRRLVRSRTDRGESSGDGVADAPEDLLALIEEGSAVRDALGVLSPLRRQLVALAFVRGMTHPEIAAALGLPLGPVKSHLRRALSALRDELAGSAEQ